MKKATLTLQDGTSFEGYSFGAEKNIVGEVVFNTAMNGYPESLTDPSYMGQMMVMTYPMVGNYGIPSSEVSPEGISRYLESEHIYMQAILVADYSAEYSHWNATSSLADRLKEEGTVGLTNIDTRALTKHLREHGSQKGTITIEGVDTPIEDARWEERNLVAEASTREVVRYGQGSKTVVLIDCGVKHNIIRQLLREDVTVVRVPWDYDFTTLSYDGVFISNGPGNPEMCLKTIENLRRVIAGDKPIYGICMGNRRVLRFISSSMGIGATINRCVWSVQITALSRVRTIVLQWMAVHWEPTGRSGSSISMTDRMRGLSIRQSPSVLYNFILRLLEDLRIRSSFSMNFFLSSRAVVSQECEGR